MLRVMLLAAAGISLVFSALTFGVIVIVRQGGATSAEVGLMLGIAGVGGLLGALIAPASACASARRLSSSRCSGSARR